MKSAIIKEKNNQKYSIFFYALTHIPHSLIFLLF